MMDNEKRAALRADLIDLMKKHEIRNASFCGTAADGDYCGLMSVQEPQKVGGIFESALNVGRLWQYTRGTIRTVLDDFEK